MTTAETCPVIDLLKESVAIDKQGILAALIAGESERTAWTPSLGLACQACAFNALVETRISGTLRGVQLSGVMHESNGEPCKKVKYEETSDGKQIATLMGEIFQQV